MMQTILIGNGTLAEYCLETLLKKKFKIIAVVTADSVLASAAYQNEINVYSNLKECLENTAHIDILFSVINFDIIPASLLKKITISINYHDSLLPKYAGINSTSHAVNNQEERHGITWHLIQKEIDTGNIILQEFVEIQKNDTTESLNLKCYKSAILSFEKVLGLIKQDTLFTKKQNLKLRTYFGIKNNYLGLSAINPLEQTTNKLLAFINACNFGKEDNYFGLPIIYIDSLPFVIKAAKLINFPTKNKKLILKTKKNYLEIVKIEDHLGNSVNLDSLIKITPIVQSEKFIIDIEKEKNISNEISKQKYYFAEKRKYDQKYLNNKASNLFKISSIKKINNEEQFLNLTLLLGWYFLKATLTDEVIIWFNIDKFKKQKPNITALEFSYFIFKKEEVQNFHPINLLNLLKEKIKLAPIINKFFFARHKRIADFPHFDNADIIIDWLGFNFNENSLTLIYPKILPQITIQKETLFAIENNLAETITKWLEIFYKNKKITLKEVAFSTSEETLSLIGAKFKQRTKYSTPNNLVEWFDNIANKYPKNISLVEKNKKYTYSELKILSEKYANALIKKGIKKSQSVIIALDNQINVVISILSILRIGANYVPIQTEYPAEQINYILKNSNSNQLITDNQKFAQIILSIDIPVSLYYFNKLLIKNTLKKFNQTLALKDDVAYIIFTSGTTGKPKGVILTHGNIIRLFKSTETFFKFDSTDKWVFFHSYSFDFSVWEIFGALLYGGTLHIPEKEIKLDPSRFSKYLLDNKITILNQTPTYFYNLIPYFPLKNFFLKFVIFGGEKLNFQLLSPLKELIHKKIKFINMYGITEAAVHATFYNIQKTDTQYNISFIGKTLKDISYIILDNSLKSVPKGFWGQLCLGGKAISTGYLNDKNLTDTKFISITHNKKIFRFFITGDLVRETSNGNLEYLGRNDAIKKIRGYRINLQEIQDTLESNCKIEKAFILVDEKQPESKLIAFYKKNNANLSKGEIRQYLSNKLPLYMVPSKLIEVNSFPLTFNGKINEKLLAQSNKIVTENKTNIAPISNKLSVLKNIWKKCTKSEPNNDNEDFFNAGGTSLTAMQFAYDIYKNIGCNIELENIYNLRNFKKIAKFVLNSNKNNAPMPSSILSNKSLIQTPSEMQEAIWFSHEFMQYKSEYNVGFVLILNNTVNLDKLLNAINLVIKNNPSTNICFLYKNNNLFAHMAKKNNIFFNRLKDKKTLFKFIRNNFKKELDIKKLTLSINIIQTKQDNIKALYLKAHHIIFDGESLIHFLKLIFSHYKYKNIKQTLIKKSIIYDKNISYFKNNQNSFLSLIINRAAIINPNFQNITANFNQHLKFTISNNKHALLLHYANKNNSTVYIIYLLVFYLTLFSIWEGKVPLIGLSINSRDISQLNTLGTFANLLPFSIDKSLLINPDIKNLISETNNIIQTLLSCKKVSYKIISNMLRQKGKNNFNLFPAVFTYNDFSEKYLTHTAISHFALLRPINPKYELNLEVIQHKHIILFELSTVLNIDVRNFKLQYEYLLNNILDNKINLSFSAKINFINFNTSKLINDFSEKSNLDCIEKKLSDIICSYVSEKNFDSSAGFFELGISSLDLIKICCDIKNKFDINVSPIDFFKNTNVSAMAIHIEKKLIDSNTIQNHSSY